jgi:hypothetical protein
MSTRSRPSFSPAQTTVLGLGLTCGRATRSRPSARLGWVRTAVALRPGSARRCEEDHPARPWGALLGGWRECDASTPYPAGRTEGHVTCPAAVVAGNGLFPATSACLSTNQPVPSQADVDPAGRCRNAKTPLRDWLKIGTIAPMASQETPTSFTGTTCAMPESPKTRFPARRPRLFGWGTNVGPDRAGGLGPEHQLAYERVKRRGSPPPNKAKMTVRAWCKAPRCTWTAEGRFGPVTAAFDKHSRVAELDPQLHGEHPVAAGALEGVDLELGVLVGGGAAGVAEQMSHAWNRRRTRDEAGCAR